MDMRNYRGSSERQKEKYIKNRFFFKVNFEENVFLSHFANNILLGGLRRHFDVDRYIIERLSP